MKNRMIVKVGIIALIILSVNNSFSQTSVLDKYEYYTRETGNNALGYYQTSINLLNKDLKQDGFRFTYNYLLFNIASFPLNSNNQISITMDAAFRIGASLGELEVTNPPENFPSLLKYYTISADLFSMSIVPDYTYVFESGFAISARFGFNFFNVGGTASLLEKGTFKENTIIVIKIVPMAFNPSLYFDFGRSGLGIGFYINPSNFLSYVIAPDNLYNEEYLGIQFWDNIVEEYEFQVLFNF